MSGEYGLLFLASLVFSRGNSLELELDHSLSLI